MTIDFDELLEAEPDDGWRWDREHPPDEFTPAMIRRMSIATLRELRQPDNGILNESQQRSFDAAFTEWWEPTRRQLSETISRFAMPKFDFTGVMPKFDFKGVMPKLDAARFIPPELSASWNRSLREAAAQVSASAQIDKSTTDLWPNPPAATPIAPRISDETTAAALEASVERNAEHLAVLESIATILSRQEQSATRGGFFYVIVSIMVIIAGVAPLVTMESGSDRFWTLVWSAGLSAIAGAAYLYVRSRQRGPRTGGES